MTRYPALLFVVVASLAASACVIEEQRSVEDGAATLADIEVATEDGAASYRFRFEKVIGGPLVTLVESPLGYPEAVIPSECALETFLRVADRDAIVPRELLKECGVRESDGSRRALRAVDGDFRAGELNVGGLGVEYREGLQRICSEDAFEKRLLELEELASYQPLVSANCQTPCELWVVWDETGCATYDGAWDLQAICPPATYADLVNMYGSSGMGCLTSGPPQCDQVPNPECDHKELVYGDKMPGGPWWWSLFSAGSVTTRVRAELTNCGGNPVRGYWQVKELESEPWGTQNEMTFAPGSTGVVILSAGYENDNWRGWDFLLYAEGSDFRVASAWVELQGRNRFTCPLMI